MKKHPLLTFREASDLSQQGLADLLGCSQSLVAHIELGERTVSKDNAAEWEEKTGIPRMSLLYPEEFPFVPPKSGGAKRAAAR